MEYEKCYVFDPKDVQNPRPIKKRRVEPSGLQVSWPLRRTAYRNAWAIQKQAIDARLHDMNAATVRDVSDFLDEKLEKKSSRIPTGIILSGANSAAYSTITSQIGSSKTKDGRRLFTSLPSTSGSNLKAILKTLIHTATARNDGESEEDEEEEVVSTNRIGPRLLKYDLQLLHDFVVERKVSQIIISFENTEAFDGHLLSELIELFGCWLDRIPFVCLFGVATSVDFLQQRLSRAAIKCLDGRLFDIAPSADETEQIFDAIVNEDVPFWIGPSLAGMMLERQRDYIQSIDNLVDAAQYAHLSCYYANALTVFMIPSIKMSQIPDDHFEALRTLNYVQGYIQDEVDKKNFGAAKSLLESNKALFDFCQEKLAASQDKMENIMIAIGLLRNLQQSLPGVQASSQSNLYVQAMSGKLADSPLLRSLLLSVRKAPSDVSVELLRNVINLDLDFPQDLLDETVEVQKELGKLTAEQKDNKKPLKSEDDVNHSTLRTTIVAQKVELSKQKSALSKQDTAYTSLLRRFTDMVSSFFADALVSPKTLPFNEIFFYDLKSPYREVFMPRPRHAIERALTSPHDYLDCDCCAPKSETGETETLSATQPATAVLFQLYLESGSLINVNDLWEAFRSIIGEDKSDEEVMALYQRGLAEMQYLGFVKSTRKRVDHIVKAAWPGL